MKRKVKNSKIKLQKFCHDLALALIRSAEGCNSLHVLAANNANITATESAVLHTSVGRAVENTEFERDSSTLRERLAAETWPIRYKVKQFNRNPNFVELRLTHNNIFNHQICKMISNHGKNHCALCYHRQTQYGCNLCKVLLCRIPRTRDISDGSKQHIDSCFNLWHSNRDIEVQRKALIKLGKKTDKKQRSTRSSSDGDVLSPYTPKKRKRSTEVQVLTEVRKKANKKEVKGNSDGTSNSESNSEAETTINKSGSDSETSIPSAAFASSKKQSIQLQKTPSPKKQSFQKPNTNTNKDLPASNTRSRGRQQESQLVQSPSKKSSATPSMPRSTRARSKSVGGTNNKPAAKDPSSSVKKASSSVEETPATRSRKSKTTSASSAVTTSRQTRSNSRGREAMASNTTSRQTRSNSRGREAMTSNTTDVTTTPIKVSVKMGANKEATPIKLTGVSSGSTSQDS
jgi:hypothetical protein